MHDLRAEIERLKTQLANRQAELTTYQRENERLRVVLTEAIDLAEEGWAYDSGYFREKWDVAARLESLRSSRDKAS